MSNSKPDTEGDTEGEMPVIIDYEVVRKGRGDGYVWTLRHDKIIYTMIKDPQFRTGSTAFPADYKRIAILLAKKSELWIDGRGKVPPTEDKILKRVLDIAFAIEIIL